MTVAVEPDSDSEEYTENIVTHVCTYYFSEPETLCGTILVFGIAVGMLVVALFFFPPLVWGTLAFSCLFCLRYRIMNLVLWACIVVLWVVGWRFNFGQGLTLQWQ